MSSCCNLCSKESLKENLFGLFPILNWLPKYSWKNQFFGDVMSGSTVAIMHIPQGLKMLSTLFHINVSLCISFILISGMGYALLGGVSPIIGLYMAFFPVLVYVCLGTSHHISLGMPLKM